MHLQIHRDWRAAGEHLEGAVQAALGQDRRVDAARDLAHLLQRTGRRSGGAVEVCGEVAELGWRRRARRAQLQRL